MMICADDFGLAPDVDEAVLRLAAEGKVSAVSVMVALLAEPTPALAALAHLHDRLDIGLHLVLTDEPGLTPSERNDSLHRNGRFPSFGNLLGRSLTARLRAADAHREIAAQFDWFKHLFDFTPDFLDGHRHVQQFFGVRRGLLDFMRALPAAERPYVRNAHEPLAAIFRRGVAPLKCCGISLPGAAFRRLLLAQGVATNDGFAGICDYRDWKNYPVALQGFLRHARSGNYLIMAHPGLREDWRRAEFEGLLAAKWPSGEPSRFRRATL
ncbi:MAG: ChbG/HpnK family deacetylase [Verrucomicrobia bacterium]|nr:MAG: ChbG/HpnK family deacetylase [Verrucomicrobiota bacterium]